MTPSKLKVSFTIPQWNHKQSLSGCISSIYDTLDDEYHEIVVVDIASDIVGSEYEFFKHGKML